MSDIMTFDEIFNIDDEQLRDSKLKILVIPHWDNMILKLQESIGKNNYDCLFVINANNALTFNLNELSMDKSLFEVKQIEEIKQQQIINEYESISLNIVYLSMNELSDIVNKYNSQNDENKILNGSKDSETDTIKEEKIPNFYQNLSKTLNMFNNHNINKPGFKDIVNNMINDFDSSSLQLIHNFTVSEQISEDIKENFEGTLEFNFISPTCFVVEYKRKCIGKGHKYSDCYIKENQIRFDSQILIDDINDKICFRTSVTIAYKLNFFKSCMFVSGIEKEVLKKEEYLHKQVLIPEMIKLMKINDIDFLNKLSFYAQISTLQASLEMDTVNNIKELLKSIKKVMDKRDSNKKDENISKLKLLNRQQQENIEYKADTLNFTKPLVPIHHPESSNTIITKELVKSMSNIREEYQDEDFSDKDTLVKNSTSFVICRDVNSLQIMSSCQGGDLIMTNSTDCNTNRVRFTLNNQIPQHTTRLNNQFVSSTTTNQDEKKENNMTFGFRNKFDSFMKRNSINSNKDNQSEYKFENDSDAISELINFGYYFYDKYYVISLVIMILFIISFYRVFSNILGVLDYLNLTSFFQFIVFLAICFFVLRDKLKTNPQ